MPPVVPADSRTAGKNAAGPKSAANKVAETGLAEIGLAETKPAKTGLAETEPAETRSAGVKAKKGKKKPAAPPEQAMTEILRADAPDLTEVLVVDEPPPNPTHAVQTRNAAIAALIVSVVVALSTGADLHYPGRMAFTVLFAGFVSGWVAVAYIRFRERLVEIVASVALSASMGIILAMTQLQTHLWHSRIWVTAWAVLAAGAAIPHILRKGRDL
ncbi:hypothetical protein [Paractinoplanes ferrugineus]|nr:hypothetical protein [Actinoplanes ferrugineus]